MNTDLTIDSLALLNSLRIGATPLIPLPDITARGRVWLKAEYANPYGSIKDRTAAYLLAWARNIDDANVSVVESTSGNLGLALARIGPKVGLRVAVVMDSSLPAQRIRQVRQAGASVLVVDECRRGLTFRESRIAAAREIGLQPGWLWLNQYGNEAGLHVHEQTTGPEILDDLKGAVDVIVASVGTGGTICGVGAAMRRRGRCTLIVGVEPSGSTISGGQEDHYLPAGSGMRGMPEIVKRHHGLIDFFAKVPDQIAAGWALHLMRRYGLQVGLTTGAALAVGCMFAEQSDAQVVAIAPDPGHSFRSVIHDLGKSVFLRDCSPQIQILPFSRRDPESTS
jgi:cysteine synthase A